MNYQELLVLFKTHAFTKNHLPIFLHFNCLMKLSDVPLFINVTAEHLSVAKPSDINNLNNVKSLFFLIINCN